MTAEQTGFFFDARAALQANHYLGNKGARAVWWYEDSHGFVSFARPTSRRIPIGWLELSRWCLLDGRGSQQWSACLPKLRAAFPDVTTVVSYSDPSVGHTGALYRACGWLWAPTWHVISPPPTGGGTRGGKIHAPKHRWVYLLKRDSSRESVLRGSAAKAFAYSEPVWRGNGHDGLRQSGERWREFVRAKERGE